MQLLLFAGTWIVSIGLFLMAVWLGLGLVRIHEDQVGVVVKKFGMKKLPPGRIVALEGESGYQADTLAPGIHLFKWFWQYAVEKVSVINIASGDIGLVVAIDGIAIQTSRILAKSVDCNNFQDARKFLQNAGEKGRQVAILTAGRYRINTALFNVITAANCEKHGVQPKFMRIYAVEPDKVGIITTFDGAPIEGGEIAGPVVASHNNFQDPEAFLKTGGKRGLQEQVLLSGTWNLNPWFVNVEQVEMTHVPIGSVGVVISFVGKPVVDISGPEFKHGNLVEQDHKGVWNVPLYPGKHPLNTRIMKVELVPTTNIVLNWATWSESHKFDEKLSSITVRSKDGFSYNLDVSQIIHVGALNAPKVISRVGSMRNLVDQVLEPIIGNYFRNSTQSHDVIDFLKARSERQHEAAEHIKAALDAYNVEAIDTLIGDVVPPEALMRTQTDRKLADEQRQTYAIEESAQKQRQLLVRETAMADIQKDLVQKEQGVRIAQLSAEQRVKEATGEAESMKLRAGAEAESIRLKAGAEALHVKQVGDARAEAYKAGVDAVGQEGFTAIQIMTAIGENHVKITPDTLITSGENSGGMLQSFLGVLLKERVTKRPNVVDIVENPIVPVEPS